MLSGQREDTTLSFFVVYPIWLRIAYVGDLFMIDVIPVTVLNIFNLFYIFENNLTTMKNILFLLCALLSMGGCSSVQDDRMASLDNSTVTEFDISRFMGRWYEIARYEHRFEKG